MEIKKIIYPTTLDKIQDIEDDNIDVFVELDDGYTYVVEVATHKNILTLMDKYNQDFLSAGCPFIIVKKLTEDIIESAIQTYLEYDAYWLKVHHLSAAFDIETLNAIRDKRLE